MSKLCVVLQVEKECHPSSNKEGGKYHRELIMVSLSLSHVPFLWEILGRESTQLPFQHYQEGRNFLYSCILGNWTFSKDKMALGHKICSWLRVIMSALIKYM